METAQFELYQDLAAQWRWRLRSKNGEVVATSAESYVSIHDCQRGVFTVQHYAATASIERPAPTRIGGGDVHRDQG